MNKGYIPTASRRKYSVLINVKYLLITFQFLTCLTSPDASSLRQSLPTVLKQSECSKPSKGGRSTSPQLYVTAAIPVQETATTNRLDQKNLIQLKFKPEKRNRTISFQLVSSQLWSPGQPLEHQLQHRRKQGDTCAEGKPGPPFSAAAYTQIDLP